MILSTGFAAALAFFLAVLLALKPGKSSADYLLGLWLALLFAAFVIVYLAFERGSLEALLLLQNFSLLHAPILYLYVRLLLQPDRWLCARDGLHFLLYILMSLLFLNFLSRFDPLTLDRLMTRTPFPQRPLDYQLMNLLDAAATPVYATLAWRLLRDYRRQLKDRVSSLGHLEVGWLHWLLVAVAGLWISVDLPLLSSYVLATELETPALQYGFSVAALFVFLIAVKAVRQGPLVWAPAAGSAYRRSGLSPEAGQQVYQQLLQYLKQSEVWRDGELDLSQLAQALEVSAHNLSQCINQYSEGNFFDFINGFRVRAFQAACRVQPPERVLDLAFDCGFNAKTSFNRIFRKHTGLTPSAYIRQLD